MSAIMTKNPPIIRNGRQSNDQKTIRSTYLQQLLIFGLALVSIVYGVGGSQQQLHKIRIRSTINDDQNTFDETETVVRRGTALGPAHFDDDFMDAGYAEDAEGEALLEEGQEKPEAAIAMLGLAVFGITLLTTVLMIVGIAVIRQRRRLSKQQGSNPDQASDGFDDSKKQKSREGGPFEGISTIAAVDIEPERLPERRKKSSKHTLMKTLLKNKEKRRQHEHHNHHPQHWTSRRRRYHHHHQLLQWSDLKPKPCQINKQQSQQLPKPSFYHQAHRFGAMSADSLSSVRSYIAASGTAGERVAHPPESMWRIPTTETFRQNESASRKTNTTETPPLSRPKLVLSIRTTETVSPSDPSSTTLSMSSNTTTDSIGNSGAGRRNNGSLDNNSDAKSAATRSSGGDSFSAAPLSITNPSSTDMKTCENDDKMNDEQAGEESSTLASLSIQYYQQQQQHQQSPTEASLLNEDMSINKVPRLNSNYERLVKTMRTDDNKPKKNKNINTKTDSGSFQAADNNANNGANRILSKGNSTSPSSAAELSSSTWSLSATTNPASIP